MLKLFLATYAALWHIALPFLHRKPRLADGWEERTLAQTAGRDFDLWIQSASGGESLLSQMVLTTLAEQLEGSDRRLRILATSTTREGINTLRKTPTAENIDLTVAFFPFDAPAIITRAFNTFRPRLAVLVETELWPAWLITARCMEVPVLLVNGRMSDKSCHSYRRLRRFFTVFGPGRVLAMSEEDAARFRSILPPERVQMVPNLKFDRMEFSSSTPPFSFQSPKDSPFIVFGSVRAEEEEQIARCLDILCKARPDATIALFPKHPARASALTEMLASRRLPARLRSSLKETCVPGTVIVWDSFGDLAAAWSRADAAFVGGSLCGWGGHNFLEPLACGVRPVIGHNWKNFAWIGREVISCGLVSEVEEEQQLARTLLERLASPDNRDEVRHRAENLFAGKRGGTAVTCTEILAALNAKP